MSKLKKNLQDPSCFSCSIQSSTIFSNLEESELRNLIDTKSCLRVKKGTLVFKQHTRPKGLFCVNSGKLKVIQTGIEGKDQIVHLVKPGDVMGYRAILNDDRYSCSAVAIEESVLCFIPRDVFVSLVQKSLRLAHNLIRLFSEELKAAEQNITELAQKPVRERLAQTLLLLKGTYGLDKDNQTINIVITREEIANLTGTTRETAIRLLSEFDNSGIIELSGKKIRIKRPAELAQIANVINY